MADIRLVTNDLVPPGRAPRRHLLSIGDLERDDVERILGIARTLARSLERECLPGEADIMAAVRRSLDWKPNARINP